MSLTKITIIYDNRKHNCDLKEGWGFSALIEQKDQKILFDTGGDHDAFVSNTEKLGIQCEELTHLFFSHKHWDHTKGFAQVLEKLPNQTQIYLPRGFPNSLLKQTPTHLKLNVVKGFTQIDETIFSLVLRGGFMLHEQALLLKTTKGIVIITGCAHPGIVDIIKATQKQLPGPIHCVLGGFHLFRESQKNLNETVEQFRALKVEKVAPCHCSGDQALLQFQEAYQDNYFKIGTGTILTIP